MKDTAHTPEYLLAYCERAGNAALWAEPLNAITNLAFLWFAYKTWQLFKNTQDRSFKQIGDIWVLTLAMAGIGIGSGLWHTHAAPGWTVIADIIPIYIFINVCVFSLFMRLMHFTWLKAALVWVVFTAASVAAEIYLPKDLLNGSVMYAPSWLMLGISALILKVRQSPYAPDLWFAVQIFTLSLFFRTIDMMTCDSNPFGTHFLWHLLNSLLLFNLVKTLVKSTQK